MASATDGTVAGSGPEADGTVAGGAEAEVDDELPERTGTWRHDVCFFSQPDMSVVTVVIVDVLLQKHEESVVIVGWASEAPRSAVANHSGRSGCFTTQPWTSMRLSFFM